MKKLLSLPPNLVECFHDIEHANHQEWFCTSDPVGSKLGSGGGTAWLLQTCKNSESDTTPLTEWLAHEKRILLHAGGKVGDCPHMLLPVKYLPQSQFSAGDVVKSLHKTYCHFSFPCMSKSCRKPRRNCIHLLPAEMYISVQNKPYKKSPMQTLYVTDCG